MTSVSPVKDGKVEVIELGDNNKNEEQNGGENDEDNEYVDNDNDATEEPKEEKRIKKQIVKRKLNEVWFHMTERSGMHITENKQ